MTVRKRLPIFFEDGLRGGSKCDSLPILIIYQYHQLLFIRLMLCPTLGCPPPGIQIWLSGRARQSNQASVNPDCVDCLPSLIVMRLNALLRIHSIGQILNNTLRRCGCSSWQWMIVWAGWNTCKGGTAVFRKADCDLSPTNVQTPMSGRYCWMAAINRFICRRR